MKLTVKPSARLKGSIQLPGSKSYSIRAFFIAACGGRSAIFHSSDCDDALVSMGAARVLGATIVKKKNKHLVKKTRFPKKIKPIDIKESGTALRFCLPLAAVYSSHFRVSGKGTLRGRPNAHLTKTLRAMGLNIKGRGRKDSIPLTANGGKLTGKSISIDGSLSSQFISALLIACPQLGEDTTLTITGRKMVSVDYIDMTLNVLKQAGVTIKKAGARKFVIKGNQPFRGLKNFVVPSDLGLAAFMLAAGALVQSDILLKGQPANKLKQADEHIIPFLRKMGARLSLKAGSIRLKGPFPLKGGTFSLKDCPDLVPIMAVLALFARGTTRLKNIAHARAKESNRVSDLRRELLKTGADVKEKKDELIITPRPHYRSNASLNPHQDHRLAMAFAVLGLKIGAKVQNIECTNKSYPGFVRDIKALKANVQIS